MLPVAQVIVMGSRFGMPLYACFCNRLLSVFPAAGAGCIVAAKARFSSKKHFRFLLRGHCSASSRALAAFAFVRRLRRALLR